jgi:excisionase family DNA binding protein
MQLLTVKEIADRLKIHHKTVYDQIYKGTFPIPARRLPGIGLRFRESDLVRYVNKIFRDN